MGDPENSLESMSLDQLKEQAERARLIATLEQAKADRRVYESVSLSADVIDRDAVFRDEHGLHWTSRSARAWPLADANQQGPLKTLEDLTRLRNESRWLAATNDFAKRALSALRTYTAMGWRHQVRLKAGVDEAQNPGLAEKRSAAQRVLDEWRKKQRMPRREKAAVVRAHRDGEIFLRKGLDQRGMLAWRWVEPDQVAPPESQKDKAPWGVVCEKHDAEWPRGYYVDGQFEPASKIQHVKINVDDNMLRGVPTFMGDLAEDLRLARKMTGNGAQVTAIWAAIAWIRKHEGRTAASVDSWRKDQARWDLTTESGRTRYFADKTGKPRILDAPKSTEYEFPTSGLSLANVELMVQVVLRSAAAALDLPEWMLTAKNDSVNFASALVSESPVLLAFKDRHEFWQPEFEEWSWEGLLHEADRLAGRGGMPSREELETFFTLHAEPPEHEIRDPVANATAARTLREGGVLSPQTWSARAGLDYEEEQKQLEAYRKANGGVDPVLDAMAGAPGLLSTDLLPPDQPEL